MNPPNIAAASAALALLLVALGRAATAEVPPSGSAPVPEAASRTFEDGGTGPHKALMASDRTLATHTVFRPRELTGFGGKAKLRIIAWGNGACANSPWEHVNFRSEIASHGFVVVAIGLMPEEGQRGGRGGPTRSARLTDAIDWAIARSGDPSSQYFGKLAVDRMADWTVEKKGIR